MSARLSLGRQFTVVHAFNERDSEGQAKVLDRAGNEVHRVGYARRPHLDENGFEIPGSAEISGFERYAIGHTFGTENMRKGYGTAAQDAISAAHPGVPLVSYTEDMTESAHAFRQAYMKRRPGVDWQVKEGTRW